MQNNNNGLPQQIAEQAAALGYEQCGIIRIGDILDYQEKLDERIERTPENREKYSALYRFAGPQEQYPWAKSIVVCIRRYGKYRIPEHLQNRIAKYYLVDGRRDALSPDYKASVAFDAYLHSLGLTVATERKFGVTALRWAAHKAGLGIIRRNNFFYTDSGSWVYIEAWLTDRDMELKTEHTLKPCPPNCDRCISACPTKSLREPYVMSRATCISCLTTWDGDDWRTNPHHRQVGPWIFGCDICQDVCPFNRGKWNGQEEYPGLMELSEMIGLEKLIDMDYETLLNVIQPKFWYIGKDRIWKWKTNALNAINNMTDARYKYAVVDACLDSCQIVRDTALWVKGME